MTVPFDTVLTILKQHETNGDFPGYQVRADYLKSLYFYASLLPENATVVELGTLYGCSLVTMAAALKGSWSIVGIDPALKGTFHYPDQHQPEGHRFTSSYERVLKLADECGIDFNNADSPATGVITLYGEKSWDVLKLWKDSFLLGNNSVSLLLIDGEHSIGAIKKDLEWGSLVKPNGYMVLDDYLDFVERYLKEYIQKNPAWTILHESTQPPVGDYIVTIVRRDAVGGAV